MTAALCAVLAGGVACGNAYGPSAGATTEAGPPEGDSGGLVGWHQPFNGSGIEVDSLEQAAADLPFEPYVPKLESLGQPTVFESPKGTPKDFMAITLVFDSDTYGTVWLVESSPDIPDDAERLKGYEGRVAANDDPSIHTDAQLEYIRGGIPALVGEGTIEWVEDGVQLSIKGERLEGSVALDIAKAV
jgi:hypothetical protein